MVGRVTAPAPPARAGSSARAGVSLGPLGWTLVLLLALLALATVLRGAGAVARPAELMYGEAIIYDQVGRLFRGEALYQSLDRAPFTVTAYTPVYYYLAALARVVAGPGFAPGRVVSLAAGAGCAALVWWFARRIDGRRRAGWLAVLLFLGLGLPWGDGGPTPWPALYKEDALGVAFSLAAMAVLAARSGRRAVVVAGLLAGLAVLTKQSLVASLVAGACWLFWRDRGRAALYAGTCLALIFAVAGGFEAATHAFVANTVTANANPLRLGALSANLTTLLLYQLGVLLAAGFGFSRRSMRSQMLTRGGPLAWYWLATALSLAGLAKVGSNHNYWMELAAVTAIAAALAVWHDVPGSGPSPPAAPVWRNPLFVLMLTPMLWLGPSLLVAVTVAEGAGWLWPGASAADSKAFASLVERVRSTEGMVLADPLDVVALADRPVYLEPYLFSILAAAGNWDAGPVVEHICDGDVRLAVLDRPLDAPDAGYQGYSHWPSRVRVALRRAMALEVQVAGRYVYAPRRQSSPDLALDCARP